ncbi:cytoplasmic dynein 2 heavy chain 1, partial [Cystoisospora suis]
MALLSRPGVQRNLRLEREKALSDIRVYVHHIAVDVGRQFLKCREVKLGKTSTEEKRHEQQRRPSVNDETDSEEDRDSEEENSSWPPTYSFSSSRTVTADLLRNIRKSRKSLKNVRDVTETFLKDLRGSGSLRAELEEAEKTVEGFGKQLFQEWCAACTATATTTGGCPLPSVDDPVLSFDDARGGALRLHFSSSLLQLVDELRLFDALGYQVPLRIRQSVEVVVEYHKSAVLLQQVCDYYNSLNEEILEFHKPLLLREAVEFEKTVQRGCSQKAVSDREQKGSSAALHPRVTWGDVKTLEDFAIEVEEKFLRLQKKNRQLQRDHE